jgi:hypothetical protein
MKFLSPFSLLNATDWLMQEKEQGEETFQQALAINGPTVTGRDA